MKIRIVLNWKRFIFLLATCLSNTFCQFSIGDTLEMWLGYSDFTGMSGGKSYANEVVDSISNNGDTTFYHFNVISVRTDGFFEAGGSMRTLINSGEKTQLAILNKTPTNLTAPLGAFLNLKWIIGGKSSLIFFKGILNLGQYSLIPIVNKSNPNDSFTVRASDSLGVKWKTESTSPFIVNGEFIKYEGAIDKIGKIMKDSSLCCPNGHRLYYQYGMSPISFLNISSSSDLYIKSIGETIMGPGNYDCQLTSYKKFKSVSISSKIKKYGVTKKRADKKYLANGKIDLPLKEKINMAYRP